MQVIFKNSDLSDCDSCKPSDQPISENFNEAQSSNNQWDALSCKADVLWKRISDRVNRGRAAGKNFFFKDRDQHYILKKVSNQKDHSSHFVCLLMSPWFVQFKNIILSMDKLMTKIFLWNFAYWKNLLVFK